MKIKELRNHVYSRTIEDLEIPIENAITQEEFNRRGIDVDKVDFRERVVTRLIEMKVPFASEWSTTFHLAKEVLKCECPYCHGPMDAYHAGGSSSVTNVKFRCTNNQCGAKVNVRLQWDAVSLEPPRAKK